MAGLITILFLGLLSSVSQSKYMLIELDEGISNDEPYIPPLKYTVDVLPARIPNSVEEGNQTKPEDYYAYTDYGEKGYGANYRGKWSGRDITDSFCSTEKEYVITM